MGTMDPLAEVRKIQAVCPDVKVIVKAYDAAGEFVCELIVAKRMEPCQRNTVGRIFEIAIFPIENYELRVSLLEASYLLRNLVPRVECAACLRRISQGSERND
ncbi:unnamed protein product [Leptidea sinapis]|uniref:Uncharacterized protein n=1 Tax=Leptidea sinapis TaxID=189913 RepID=A0A5E4R2L5_9NEOP|nr:unnamed protein product [Leptidea sinapis]